MRILLILCMVAFAKARPQYTYAGGISGGIGNSLGGGLAGAVEEPQINKHFYLHAAPEEPEASPKHFTLGRPQRNYRVVFIKAPSVPHPKLSAEFAPQEEKTVIYVLAQKEQEFDPNDIATPAPTPPSKPEVFFIKYKTPEEAAHAQQQIQAQYDLLGGQSQVSDEGTVPVSSAIGLGSNGLSSGLNGGISGASSALSGQRAYLPPSHKR